MQIKVQSVLTSTILLLSLYGCAPVWTVNRWNLERKSTQITRPLSKEEQDWVSASFQARKQAMPRTIGEWSLSESSSDFVITPNPKEDGRILGLRFRFIYTSQGQEPIRVYQFINPLFLRFDEIAMGSYTYFHYHYPKDFVLKSPVAYIFGDRWLLPIPDVAPNDRSFIAAKSTWITNGYFGPNWIAEIGAPKTDNPNRCCFSLKFRSKDWRKENYGEYWLVASKAKDTGDPFTLTLYNQIFGKPL